MGVERFNLRSGFPDFLDLPWEIDPDQWEGSTSRIVELPRGISRHKVVFVEYDGEAFALKWQQLEHGIKEYDHLRRLQGLKLPSVVPVGYVVCNNEESVLITKYLDNALPYRSLFSGPNFAGYREHLLDAMAGLLVQLHLAGVYWGDCSLSNTLFRRDAGKLQAYLVDAETIEIHENLSSGMRVHDLDVMTENVIGGLTDLIAAGDLEPDFPALETGESVFQRYQNLWNEITRECQIELHERFRIKERISALNDLGFSVEEIEIQPVNNKSSLRFRVNVTDRNFHRNQLFSLTGIDAEEGQASQLMHEIMEHRANLSDERGQNVTLSVAAWHWMNHLYTSTLKKLASITRPFDEPPELYCKYLLHKWFLSEKVQKDVGRDRTIEDMVSEESPFRSQKTT